MSYTAPPLTTAVLLEGSDGAPALTLAVVLGEAIWIEATFSALLPPVSLTLRFSAQGQVLDTARYLVPALTTAVVLAGGYTPPPLNLPVVLGGLVRIIAGTFVAHLPAPELSLSLSASATQDLALLEAIGPRLRQASAQSQTRAAGQRARQQAMQTTGTRGRWSQTTALPLPARRHWPHTQALPVPRAVRERAAHGVPQRHAIRFPSAEALRTPRDLTERAAHGPALRQGAGLPAAEALRTRRTLTAPDAASLPLPGLRLRLGQTETRRTFTRLTLRWTAGDDPKPGRWWPFYEVPPLTAPVVLHSPYTPRPLRCPVALGWTWIAQPACPADPDGPITVPIQEVYLVVNTFSLVRADTGQPVDALDFSASLDAESWGWSWSARIPASQMDRVRPPALGEFVELIATVNGTALHLVVEGLSRSRSFGSASLTIRGRGRAAWLADPHSPIQTVINAETRTAQQLLNEALTVNGVPLGWSVDWQVEDWSVAAGLFSHTGTYLSAAIRIAEAAGGYVQADAALQTLHILPYYPLAPWAWASATPDLILPEAVCTTEGIDWQDTPAYNTVWIVGVDGGRRDQVKRAGTAGDFPAPTVADPLATSTIMTRQRGLRVLADTGRQAHLSLSLPILPETGIIPPGQLLEYTEQGVTHRGLTRAVSVSCQFPTARQTIKVETHELESV